MLGLQSATEVRVWTMGVTVKESTKLDYVTTLSNHTRESCTLTLDVTVSPP